MPRLPLARGAPIRRRKRLSASVRTCRTRPRTSSRQYGRRQTRYRGPEPARRASRNCARSRIWFARPDRARLDDLVGPLVLQDAVLMDPGLVHEGMGADDRFVLL